jgi:enamine deaminase RidA (YjgF/YER057c/UK114 family)
LLNSRQETAVSLIESKLHDLGLSLPRPLVLPPGVELPFSWVRVHGNRAYISGHAAQNADGSLASPLGKVGAEVSLEQARQSARLTALSILGSLKRALGDLDRIAAWLRVFGMVNSASGFRQQPAVINGFTELIIELYGPDRGLHARSAVGMAELAFGIPVEIEAEVAIEAD